MPVLSLKSTLTKSTLAGLILVAFYALVAFVITKTYMPPSLRLSPLVIGVIFGIIHAHTLTRFIPQSWGSGVNFSAKHLLNLGIILYGFRLTFSDIAMVGLDGFIISISMITLVMVAGYLVGTKLLKMDKDTTILTCAGSAICGAAAVMATNKIVKAEEHKTVMAVATTILFGTLAMFIYPLIYRTGLLPLDTSQMGYYIGGSIHAVGHVLGAADAIAPETSDIAVIVKMIRIMMLAPFLMILAFWLKSQSQSSNQPRAAIIKSIPWFAVLFILVAGFNSLDILPAAIVGHITMFDSFIMTMAMVALGIKTRWVAVKTLGAKPFYLALFLFILLMSGGFITVMIL